MKTEYGQLLDMIQSKIVKQKLVGKEADQLIFCFSMEKDKKHIV